LDTPTYRRKEINIYSVNGKMYSYTNKYLTHHNRMKNERLSDVVPE